jgi:hypothetical protein
MRFRKCIPVSADVGGKSRRRTLLADKEDSVSNTVEIKAKVPVDLFVEAKKVSKGTSTANDIERRQIRVKVYSQDRSKRGLSWISRTNYQCLRGSTFPYLLGVFCSIRVSLVLPRILLKAFRA